MFGSQPLPITWVRLFVCLCIKISRVVSFYATSEKLSTFYFVLVPAIQLFFTQADCLKPLASCMYTCYALMTLNKKYECNISMQASISNCHFWEFSRFEWSYGCGRISIAFQATISTSGFVFVALNDYKRVQNGNNFLKFYFLPACDYENENNWNMYVSQKEKVVVPLNPHK